jgi:uncharacterized protein (TIGR00255 family)
MLHSMTGFARASGETDAARWTWEIRSVNGRGLDLKFRLPPAFEALEATARALAGQRIQRGNVQIQLSLTREATPPRVRIDTQLLASLQKSLVESGLAAPESPPDLAALMGIRGVVQVEEGIEEKGAETLIEPLAASFAEALDALRIMRAAEGAQLAEVLNERVNSIENLARRADALPGRKAEAVRERISAQIRLLMEENAAFDSQRLHQEAVLIAAKADIREELDRLLSHCAAARALLASGGAIGRKLDFLAQEFGREANTLCAKSNDVELTAIGLDLKAVIEQLREQVQNIE